MSNRYDFFRAYRLWVNHLINVFYKIAQYLKFIKNTTITIGLVLPEINNYLTVRCYNCKIVYDS